LYESILTKGRLFPFLLALAALPLLAGPAFDDQARVTLPGSVHPRLARLEPLGPVPPELPMERMLLVLKLGQEAGSRLDQLLRDQHDPASPRYHQWLTSDQFAARFGPAPAQLDAAALWLSQQGFTVHGPARSGLAISFSGTAAQVGKAFRTAIMEYDLDGARHRGNATSISLPRGLAEFAGGVLSLNDLRPAARHRVGLRARPQLQDGGGGNDLGPGDFAAIYNLGPLFARGATGKGVAVAVVGRTDIDAGDLAAFTGSFGLGQYGGSFQVVHNGADPGILSADEAFEADADTQWSTATAPGAQILLVVSPSSITTDGSTLSAQYIVDNNLAPVLTISFGLCEAALGTAGNLFYDQLWRQAASQGISVFVAAGDNGPAGCDDPNAAVAAGGAAVSGIASPPWATAVGGTMFQEGSGNYWATSISPFGVTALGYIPEAAWDESGAVAGGAGLWAGSGGASNLYPKPAWQSAPGVPADGQRDLPDISLTAAAGHDPYVVFQGGSAYLGGGTSFGAPAMAGIMALVVQTWGRQGNPNFTLYHLAQAQYGGTGPRVFHDTAAGSNRVPGVMGWSAGPGYDLATGLGSLDATALVDNWVAGADPITVTVAAPALTIASGQTAHLSGAAQDSAPGTLSYAWSFGDGASSSGSPAADHVYRITGAASVTFEATLTVSDGLHAQSASEQITVTPSGVSAAIALPVTSVGVLPGTPVGFSGSASSQNPGAAITGYHWDFGDGGSADGGTASHSFPAAPGAPYTVTLTATDATGATGQASLSVLADPALLDVNGDGSVDVRDLLAIAGAWNPGLKATSSNLNGLDFAADLNGADAIDDSDLDLWIQQFNPEVIP
jgi:hypothetical protein